MSRKYIDMSFKERITANGAYRLSFYASGKRSFAAAWDAEIPKAGSILLSFDGNEGMHPTTIDLAAHENAFAASQALPFIDLDVSGLPEGGAFIFYCLS